MSLDIVTKSLHVSLVIHNAETVTRASRSCWPAPLDEIVLSSEHGSLHSLGPTALGVCFCLRSCALCHLSIACRPLVLVCGLLENVDLIFLILPSLVFGMC